MTKALGILLVKKGNGRQDAGVAYVAVTDGKKFSSGEVQTCCWKSGVTNMQQRPSHDQTHDKNL